MHSKPSPEVSARTSGFFFDYTAQLSYWTGGIAHQEGMGWDDPRCYENSAGLR